MSALLRLPRVIERTGLSRTVIYDRIKAGTFPPPVKLSERASAWPEHEIEACNAAQIRGRSGMAAKFGIMPANGVGTIDADYRGEVGVILLNTTGEPFTVEPGMRVAQMVITKYEQIAWSEVDELDETERGTSGYGSTG